jgi:hypothetical protein
VEVDEPEQSILVSTFDVMLLLRDVLAGQTDKGNGTMSDKPLVSVTLL